MATDSKYPRSWVLEQRTIQPPNLPTLVVIPDWHFPTPQPLNTSTPQPLQPYLIPSEYDYLIQMGRVMGVNLHFTMPEETPAEFPPQAIGLIIAGGKDMHPQFYNQPVNGTILHEQSLTRFPQAMEAYQWARGDKAQTPQRLNTSTPQHLNLPILGICWGAQFLCVANGGSLIQHIPHSESHSHKQVSLSLLPSSWVSKTLNNTRYSTFCHHHQGLGSVPPNFTVTAWDVNGLPHIIERFDRGVLELGLQGHPEEGLSDPDSVRLVLAFLEECVKGRAIRDNHLAVESA